MKDQLVSFEVAKLAKEKGFIDHNECYFFDNEGNEVVNYYVNNYNKRSTLIARPTQSLLQKWLREKHNLHIAIHPKILMDNSTVYFAYLGKPKYDFDNLFETYEEALEDQLLIRLKDIE